MIRLTLVADTGIYRESLTEHLAQQTGIEVLGSVSREQWPDSVGGVSPDVVLLDLATLECLPAVRMIVSSVPEARVIAIAVPETEEHVVACAEEGIAGYVPREASLADLIAVVGSVSRGEAPCSPRITAVLLRRLAAVATDSRPTRTSSKLTQRESEILQLIEEGMSNKEIADALCIEVTTVKNHVHRILGKLHVRRRAQAAARVRRLERPLRH
jgi:two-component system nitrate/nitrite response regulator NarL